MNTGTEQTLSPPGAAPTPQRLRVLTMITLALFILTLVLGLVVAGTDRDQGQIQRIFYIHMPSFFGAFVGFSAGVVGGLQYLRTRAVKWDSLALAGIEVGLVLSLINLVTGSIWARPIWNTWWTWDPRLTSAAIMVLTYAAYLMLRAGIENPDTRRRFASVYGILAITTAILTLVIIRIRPDTIHPVIIGASPLNAQGTFEATPGVAAALLPSLILWTTFLPATLIWYRIRLQEQIERVNEYKVRVLSS